MALSARRVLQCQPVKYMMAPFAARSRAMATYTEREGKSAQRQMAEVEARVEAIRKQTEMAGDAIETANAELETRPGLEGAEKIWRYLIVGIAAVIACSSAYPTLAGARKQQLEREAAKTSKEPRN
jgi:cell pole-organizing protein PopZ